jgi:hypothetical protein
VDALNDHAYPSGLRRWALLRDQELPIPDLVLDEHQSPRALARMQDWYRRHTPDAILDCLSGCPWRHQVARLRSRPAYASLFLLPGSPRVDGVRFDQHHVCAQAVTQVVGMLHRGEFGLPTIPLISTIRGHWSPARQS